MTQQEEVIRVLGDVVSAGKIGCVCGSNFSGWHLMKSLAVSDRYGLTRTRPMGRRRAAIMNMNSCRRV